MIWRQPEPRSASSSDAAHDDRWLGEEEVGARRVPRRALRPRGGIALTSIAFHADQLWFSAPGGIGTYVRELVPALERADPSISLTLFRSRWTDGGPPREWLDGRAIVEIPATIRSLYPRWNLLSRPRLPKTLRSLDVVHATNPAAIPPATTGQGLVVTVHDLAFEHLPELFERSWRALYRLGLRAAVRRADAIIVPSRATGDDLLSRTAADPERLHVVPLAASLPTSGEDPTPAALERLGIPSPYILSVGTLEPRKNLVRLVRAYRLLVAHGLAHSLILAGPLGWRSRDLLAEIAKDGGGRIVRTGALAGADLDAAYRGASVHVYPSLYEGFGLPVLEAMARGVPTIASNGSSIPEVSGTAACLVDPLSETDIAAAIERVLADEKLAAEMRLLGQKQAQTFSWAATAERTITVYRGLAP